jgi:hypothetical protein
MAKQPPKVNAATRKLLKDLGSDPKVLSDFIKDPEAVMSSRNIPDHEKVSVRNWLALEIAKKLVVTPDAYHVHW